MSAWPVRSVLAGAAGTATMTAAYACERRLRGRATSLGTHAAYVAAVAAVDDAVRRSGVA